MAEAFRYKAFISYSHKDQKWASWLHRRLENYKFPDKTIGKITDAGPVPKSLKPIFRDREELTAGSSLGDVIESALDASENLIVICSPNAVASHWVNQEILYFKRRHGGARIFTVIIDGEPFASDLPDGEGQECLPEALRFELGDDGELSDRPAEPLAADLRSEGDGRRFGTLKLISGMVGLGLDDLVQRDLQRARRRVIGITSLASAVVLAMGSLTWLAVDARGKAEQGREDAEGQIEFMITDLKDELKSVGNLSALKAVGERASTYYDKYDLSEHSDDALGRRARVFHYLGETLKTLGDKPEAIGYFERAHEATDQLLKRRPNSADRIFDHAQSVYWVGSIQEDSGNFSEAMKNYLNYVLLAEKLRAIEPGSLRSKQEYAYAETNVGIINFLERNYLDAIERFEAALPIFREVSLIHPNSVSSRYDYADQYAWIGMATLAEGNVSESFDNHVRQQDILDQILVEEPNNFFIRKRRIACFIGLLNSAKLLGQFEQAEKIIAVAEKELGELRIQEPADDELLKLAIDVMQRASEYALLQHNYPLAKQRLLKSRDLTAAREVDLSSDFIAREYVPLFDARIAITIAILTDDLPGFNKSIEKLKQLERELLSSGRRDLVDHVRADVRFYTALKTNDSTPLKAIIFDSEFPANIPENREVELMILSNHFGLEIPELSRSVKMNKMQERGNMFFLAYTHLFGNLNE